MAKILGRPPKCNLLRDGFEAAAAHVAQVMRHTRGDHLLLVPADGRVRVLRACRLDARDIERHVVSPDYVGTYNPTVLAEILEGDLLAHEREIRAAMARRKAA